MFGRGAVFEAYKYMGDRGHSYDAWLKYSKYQHTTQREVGFGER